MEKYGFVYIWFDKRDKRYYVGCHWGYEDDGYICSSNWMRNTYNRRQADFKRRIIKRVYTTRQDLFAEEQRYLNMIKPEEVRVRYFNLHITVGHWSSDPNKLLTISEKLSKARLGVKRGKYTQRSEEHCKKLSEAKKGTKLSEETKQKIGEASLGRLHSEETKQKMSESSKGKIFSEETKLKMKIARANQIITVENREKRSNTMKGRTSPMKGRNQSEEARRKISIARSRPRGPQRKLTCPHCNMIGGINNMLRFHMGNCKENYE